MARLRFAKKANVYVFMILTALSSLDRISTLTYQERNNCTTWIGCNYFAVTAPKCGRAEISHAEILNISLVANDCKNETFSRISILWNEFFDDQIYADFCRDKLFCSLPLVGIKHKNEWSPSVWLKIDQLQRVIRLPVFLTFTEKDVQLPKRDPDFDLRSKLPTFNENDIPTSNKQVNQGNENDTSAPKKQVDTGNENSPSVLPYEFPMENWKHIRNYKIENPKSNEKNLTIMQNSKNPNVSSIFPNNKTLSKIENKNLACKENSDNCFKLLENYSNPKLIKECRDKLCEESKRESGCDQDLIANCVQFLEENGNNKILQQTHTDVLHIVSLLNLTHNDLKSLETFAKEKAEQITEGKWGNSAVSEAISKEVGKLLKKMYNISYSASRDVFVTELKNLKLHNHGGEEEKAEIEDDKKQSLHNVFQCKSACEENGGTWTPWSGWTNCPEGCVSGSIGERTRTCHVAQALTTSLNCDGQIATEYTACSCPSNERDTEIREGPKTGIWEGWSPWSPCSVTCGLGMESQRRRCIPRRSARHVSAENCWELIDNKEEYRKCIMKKSTQPQINNLCKGQHSTSRPCIMATCDQLNGQWVKRVLEGNDRMMNCGISDVMSQKLMGKIYWVTPRGQRISPSSNVSRMYLDSDSLVVMGAQKEDQGIYHCVLATSDEGDYRTTDTQLEVMTCFSTPCKNGGTCLEEVDETKNTVKRAMCSCPFGFYGDICQHKDADHTYIYVIVGVLSGVVVIIGATVLITCWIKRNNTPKKSTIKDEDTQLIMKPVSTMYTCPAQEDNRLDTSIVNKDDSISEITEQDYKYFKSEKKDSSQYKEEYADKTKFQTDIRKKKPSQRTGVERKARSADPVLPAAQTADHSNRSFNVEETQKSYLTLHGFHGNTQDQQFSGHASYENLHDMKCTPSDNLDDTYLSMFRNDMTTEAGFSKNLPENRSKDKNTATDSLLYGNQKLSSYYENCPQSTSYMSSRKKSHDQKRSKTRRDKVMVSSQTSDAERDSENVLFVHRSTHKPMSVSDNQANIFSSIQSLDGSFDSNLYKDTQGENETQSRNYSYRLYENVPVHEHAKIDYNAGRSTDKYCEQNGIHDGESTYGRGNKIRQSFQDGGSQVEKFNKSEQNMRSMDSDQKGKNQNTSNRKCLPKTSVKKVKQLPKEGVNLKLSPEYYKDSSESSLEFVHRTTRQVTSLRAENVEKNKNKQSYTKAVSQFSVEELNPRHALENPCANGTHEDKKFDAEIELEENLVSVAEQHNKKVQANPNPFDVSDMFKSLDAIGQSMPSLSGSSSGVSSREGHVTSHEGHVSSAPNNREKRKARTNSKNELFAVEEVDTCNEMGIKNNRGDHSKNVSLIPPDTNKQSYFHFSLKSDEVQTDEDGAFLINDQCSESGENNDEELWPEIDKCSEGKNTQGSRRTIENDFFSVESDTSYHGCDDQENVKFYSIVSTSMEPEGNRLADFNSK